jgi:hypothetical protein
MQDFLIEIMLPGNPVVKKNGMTFSFRHKDKRSGRLIYREHLVKYPNDKMKAYEDLSVPALVVAKTRLEAELGYDFFPIATGVHVRFIFYRNDKRADLSNLYEAPQDLLQGKTEQDKYTHLKSRMQIILDDRKIMSHDGSRQFVEPSGNPRTLITIQPYRI